MVVQVGTPAPVAHAETYVSGAVEAQVQTLPPRDGSWLVLFFYPRDFTFICPTELHAFAELHADFEAAGAHLVAGSTDSWHVHRAWFESHPQLAGVRYPVVADTAHELSRAYGVLLEDGSALRGTFIVDPAGQVRHASVTDQSVGRSRDEVLRTLHALQTGELCPVGWRPGQPTLVAA
jgi:alkyl hydroperoxide reductase subunit AhpC